MLIASSNIQAIRELKEDPAKSFSMKDLGAAKHILGMQISRDQNARTLILSQQEYIEKILERFGMNKAKPVSTPLAAHFPIDQGYVSELCRLPGARHRGPCFPVTHIVLLMKDCFLVYGCVGKGQVGACVVCLFDDVCL